MVINIAVSGIPRGYHFPRADGNWLTEEHKQKILAITPEIKLYEVPPHRVGEFEKAKEINVLLAEGGGEKGYPGEMDREEYWNFFSPNLKWVQVCSTGINNQVTDEIREGKVILTNARNLHTIPISESVIAAMLQHAKRFKQRRTDQTNHNWNQVKCDELYGRTALILGLGNIGKRVAELCKVFNMKVIGTKRSINPVENVDIVFPSHELGEYLKQADYLVIAAPLTEETEGMISEREFSQMKENAYLINISRGKIVNEPAMVRALTEKRISGAYLDCHVTEPLPEDHVLWELDNVYVISHDSHSSPYIGDRMVEIFCSNLERFIAGEPLLYVCDPNVGY
jgi:phosphoglycerate dehydrogenase-like enzyme